MVRATEVYAKVDIASLREVGDMDMAALVERERRCASSATPFFEAADLGALREVALLQRAIRTSFAHCRICVSNVVST